MSAYVGRVVILQRRGRIHRLSIDNGNFEWNWRDGHFRHSTIEEIEAFNNQVTSTQTNEEDD